MNRTIGDAVELHKAGRLAEAAEIYKEVLARQPDNADAWHLMGLIAEQGGNATLAMILIGKAIECNPGPAHYHLDRGAMLGRNGRPGEALAALEQALRLRPDYPEAHYNRGIVLESAGRLEEALAAYDEALRLRPDYARARNNRGVVLRRLGRVEEALVAFDQALRSKPNDAGAHYNRAGALKDLGRLEEALAAYDEALRLKPDRAEAHNNRGVVLQHLGRTGEALAAYERALRLKPDYAPAHLNRGAALERHGRFEDALQAYDQALRLAPEFAHAHSNRGAVLERLGRQEEVLAAYDRALEINPNFVEAHVNRGDALARRGRLTEALASLDRTLRIRPDEPVAHNNRGNVLKDLGQFDDAAAAYRQAVTLKPDYVEAFSNHLFCLISDPAQDDATLYAAHREWGERFGRSPHALAAHRNVPAPEKTLRVGLVSANFGRHPTGYCIEGVLAAADPARVRFFCYSGHQKGDDLTERIKEHAFRWRSTVGIPDRELAEVVRADAVDILIDLAGHTSGNRLTMFALRPAPVQVTWLGYPYTTGLPAIDYALMDEAAVPAGAEGSFVEKVIRLPETRFCYAPPEYAPAPAPPPMLERGWPTFGSFNNLTKVTPEVLQLWARVLKAVPRARLVLKWTTLADPQTGSYYRDLFRDFGIEPDRIELRGASPHAQMLAEYADLDVALDPFPYSGGITSLEALWQGVPVVTLPGTTPVSRQTLGFLGVLGRGEWIARDADDYVRIAAELAADPERLAALRSEQRARMHHSPLCDRARFAQNLEAALRAMWRAWCESGSRRVDVL